MTDKKYTDEEIIKAFECCYTDKSCDECPYYRDDFCTHMNDPDNMFDIPIKVVAILNRLKAENEAVRKDIVTAEEYAWKLKAKNEALQMDNEQLKSDIINERMNLEHIQAENEDLEIKLKHFAEFLAEAEKKNEALISAQETLQKHIEKAKVEAIKEFAERLKEKAMQKFDWNEYVEVEDIDNLLKEMVGDDQ